jgi:hypothetical protein
VKSDSYVGLDQKIEIKFKIDIDENAKKVFNFKVGNICASRRPRARQTTLLFPVHYERPSAVEL